MTGRRGSLLSRIALVLAAGGPLLAAPDPATPELDTPGLRLRFEPERGSLAELLDKAAAHDHVDAATPLAPWTATLADGRVIGPADATRFAWKALAGPAPGLELTWSGFDKVDLPGLEVTVRVRSEPAGAKCRWRIALDGLGDRRLREVRFPRIAVARQDAETLAVPIWMGERCRRARDLLHGAGGPGRWTTTSENFRMVRKFSTDTAKTSIPPAAHQAARRGRPRVAADAAVNDPRVRLPRK